jgi:hypothetical protein
MVQVTEGFNEVIHTIPVLNSKLFIVYSVEVDKKERRCGECSWT